jgi:hypothetical protein
MAIKSFKRSGIKNLRNYRSFLAGNPQFQVQLYAFTSATFTPGGASGPTGPTITQARSGVGSPSWADTYLQMPGAQGIMHWTVPVTGTYRITARGANGKPASTGTGGRGVIGTGEVNLTLGEVIRISVGQEGLRTSAHGGGGGGSFVVRGASGTEESQILLVAGGGGGRRQDASGAGIDAVSTATGANPNSVSSSTNPGFSASSRGNGGAGGGADWGDGGGGFYGNGTGDANVPAGAPGFAWVNGAGGGVSSAGASGGFGGGGSGQGANGGGGGGGFSGGGGGWTAGGGGSLSSLSSTVWSYDSSVGTTGAVVHGYVTIEKL